MNLPYNGKLCLKCRGVKKLCGLEKCPILERLGSQRKVEVSDSIFGPSPPDIFVGRKGYPHTYAGPMQSLSEIKNLTPRQMLHMGIDSLIEMQTSTVRSVKVVDVNRPRDFRDIALSTVPLDVEAKVEKVLSNTSFDFIHKPMGPALKVRKVDVVDNPRVPAKVDSVVEEKARAVDGLSTLYEYGFDVDYIRRVFSAGLLGYDRKMVPTRWSITAVDDTIGKILLNKIRKYEWIERISVFESYALGNHFFVLLLPDAWSFEMLETWLRGALWTPETATIHDREGFSGRTSYADNVTGAYYAARLAVEEYLDAMKRQASVIVYREIDESYIVPLGVWVIREGMREALSKKGMEFESLDDAIGFISGSVRVDGWWKSSQSRRNFVVQRRLF